MDIFGKKFEEMSKEEQKKYYIFLVSAVAVLTFILVMLWLSYDNKTSELDDKTTELEDYQDCVTDCVSENDICLLDAVTKLDVEDCQIDLNSCVNDCEY